MRQDSKEELDSEVRRLWAAAGIGDAALAALFGVDPAQLRQYLSGVAPWPRGLLYRVFAYLRAIEALPPLDAGDGAEDAVAVAYQGRVAQVPAHALREVLLRAVETLRRAEALERRLAPVQREAAAMARDTQGILAHAEALLRVLVGGGGDHAR